MRGGWNGMTRLLESSSDCLQRYGREIRAERTAPAHWEVCARRRGSETRTTASDEGASAAGPHRSHLSSGDQRDLPFELAHACRRRRDRFVADSALEGAGFELESHRK